MYILNGVCYADKTEEKEIQYVKVLDGMMLLLTFEDGEKRLFDAHKLNGPAFECLKNPEVFKTANIEFGAVTWLNGEVDCAPEFMYNHSCPYNA